MSKLLWGGIEESSAAMKHAVLWKECLCKPHALASLNKQTNPQIQELHSSVAWNVISKYQNLSDI